MIDPKDGKPKYIWYGHWNPQVLSSDECKTVGKSRGTLPYFISEEFGLKINLLRNYLTHDSRYYNIPRQNLNDIKDYYDTVKVEKDAKDLHAEAVIFNVESNNEVTVVDYIANNNDCRQNVRRIALRIHEKMKKKG